MCATDTGQAVRELSDAGQAVRELSDAGQVVRRMIDAGMTQGDLDAAIAAYDPDLDYHNRMLETMPGMPPGPEIMRSMIAMTRSAFPDLVYTIDELVTEGDRVAVLYTWTGTHTGPMAGLPPTGRRVTATGAIFCRVANGRIVEQWDVDDRFDVMQQLGLLPATPSEMT